MPTLPVPLEEFWRQIAACSLLTEEDARSIVAALPENQQPSDVESLGQLLISQGKLTAFQAQAMCHGRGTSLVLGNYVILDELGQGGMGTVYKAVHRRMRRIVALKILSRNVTKSPELLERFQREVRAAARLEHPHVVTAYDADEFEGTHFLVMQYVDGQDLAALVRRHGPLPVRQAVDYIVQAARGLQYAHDQGVVHRDIKPGNLLLDKSGVVKILDMGLARIESADESESELTSTGAVMGTVDYMAPEQALCTRNADARSDQYSLGLTLWYLLTGRAAYGGDSLMAKLLAHRDAPIPSLTIHRSDVPPMLEAAFQRMAAKQPENRYGSIAEAADALMTSLGGATDYESRSDRMVSADQPGKPLSATSKLEWSAARSSGTMPEVNTGGPSNATTLTLQTTQVGMNAPLPHSASAGQASVRWMRRVLPWSVVGGIVWILALVPNWGHRPPPPPDAPQPTAVPVSPAWRPTPEQQAFFDHVARLPLNEQPKAVREKLREINPGYDGKGTSRSSDDGKITVFDLPSTEISELWPIRALPDLTTLLCRGVGEESAKLSDLSPLAGLPLTQLSIQLTSVSDLSPLAGMPLERLECFTTPVSDLSPLQGMPLSYLNVSNTAVADLTPLNGAPLTNFSCSNTRVTELAPLAGMKLTALGFHVTRVSDLSPLAGMPLEDLSCANTRVRDLTILRGMPLKALTCEEALALAHRDLLRGIPTLETINGRPVQDVLSESMSTWRPTPEQQAFFDEVARLPPEEQLQAVAKKLQEVNPGFDGAIRYHMVSYGKVSDFSVSAAEISDLWPMRAFPGLTYLSCSGSQETRGKLRDLSQLAGIKLKSLDCGYSLVDDLSPLKGAPLKSLKISGTKVTDLSPLEGMPLEVLSCRSVPISTLAPLAGLPLTLLDCYQTNITDLSPLAGMTLNFLDIASTKVSDLSPLEGMPLEQLHFYHASVTDLSPLKGAPLTVVSGNGTRISDLSPLAGMKLTWLSCGATQVTDLSAIEGMPLSELDCFDLPISDLSLLRGMPLQRVDCSNTKVADLSPLAGIELIELNCGGTQVSDLSPLAGMPLKKLRCYLTEVTDLSPLQGMPLTYLDIGSTRVKDLSPVTGAPLQELYYGRTLVADLAPLSTMPLTAIGVRQPHWFDETTAAWLRPSPTLKRIAIAGLVYLTPEEFWREYDRHEQAAVLFARATSVRPVAEQRAAVSERLRARNAGLEIQDEIVIRDGQVAEATLTLSDRYVEDMVRPDPSNPDRKLRDREYDLSPLLALTHLKKLTIDGGPFWLDLAVLGALPLEEITCSDDVAARNRDLFRKIKTLRLINGQPAQVAAP